MLGQMMEPPRHARVRTRPGARQGEVLTSGGTTEIPEDLCLEQQESQTERCSRTRSLSSRIAKCQCLSTAKQSQMGHWPPRQAASCRLLSRAVMASEGSESRPSHADVLLGSGQQVNLLSQSRWPQRPQEQSGGLSDLRRWLFPTSPHLINLLPMPPRSTSP